MGTRTLSIEVSEELYERFHRLVGTKLKGPNESYTKAMQSAFEVALTEFLDSMETGEEVND